MSTNKIYYTKGYKYQLEKELIVRLSEFAKLPKIDTEIIDDFVSLGIDGILVVHPGYACDGPSGPTYDTKTSIRGAFVHDVLYQMIRRGLLSHEWRKPADMIFRNILITDGMGRTRAYMWYYGVRWFANYASDPTSRRKILEAP